MILPIFLLVICLALALIITGIFLDDSAVQLVGFSFLLISGTILLGGSVQYKTGEQTSEIFVYGDHYNNSNYKNYNGTTKIDELRIFEKNISKTYDYGTFDDSTSRWVGIYLIIVSILGSAVIFTRLKQEKENSI